MKAQALRVFHLTNEVRRERAGVHTLRRSYVLDRSAQAKARRLARTGNLEHGLWWKLIWRFTGRRYDTIGENIAARQDDPIQVVREWMDSPAHRRNILAPKYTHLGVGYATRGTSEYWVQHFGGQR